MKGHNAGDRTLRAEIAACTRIMNMDGLIDYSGHISARLPGGEGLLVQSFDDSRAALEPEELLVCDFDGNVLSGGAGKKPPREVFIHTEIMRARPDVNAVGHFHPETATMFTLVEDRPLIPVKNHAARWIDGIPVHPDPGHINSVASGKALGRVRGLSKDEMTEFTNRFNRSAHVEKLWKYYIGRGVDEGKVPAAWLSGI